MGKQGPCYHCGIATTPLWRNGPPEKPILCNACGTRWRTKNTLANYIPSHSYAPTSSKSKDSQETRGDYLTFAVKQQNQHTKIQTDQDTMKDQEISSAPCQSYHPTSSHDCTSNKSSSSSTTLVSESCIQSGSPKVNNSPGVVGSSFPNFYIPRRKRTTMNQPDLSPIEKLRRDLIKIYEEEIHDLSEDSNDLLLFNKDTNSFSCEIGLGCSLISLSTCEENSYDFNKQMADERVSHKKACMQSPHWTTLSKNIETSSSEEDKSQIIQDSIDTNVSKDISAPTTQCNLANESLLFGGRQR